MTHSDLSVSEQQNNYDEKHLEHCLSYDALRLHRGSFPERFKARKIALCHFIEMNSKNVIDFCLYSLRAMIMDNNDGCDVCITLSNQKKARCTSTQPFMRRF